MFSRMPRDFRIDKAKAKEIIGFLLAKEVPEWHGIPCTLAKAAIERIVPLAQEMKAALEINGEQLDAILDVLGVQKPPQ